MENILAEMIGRKIDVLCSGGSSIRGEVVSVTGGILQLKGDDHVCFVAIDKISVVWEVTDSLSRAGFVA